MLLDAQDGVTGIMVAARNGHKDVVELLISCGADVNHQNKVRIPLHALTCNLTYFVEGRMDGSVHDSCCSQNRVLRLWSGHDWIGDCVVIIDQQTPPLCQKVFSIGWKAFWK